MLTHAVSEVSTSSGRDNFRDNFGNNSAQRTLSETRDFLNRDCIMTVLLIDQVEALPAASLQGNF
jgi:hypothetical protein